MSTRRGFSLLELMLVVAIVAAVSAIGFGSYRNFGKNVELTTTAHTIAADLKLVRSKSMIGEGGYKWGAHFVNGTTDYYELFSTPTNYADPTKDVIATTTLPQGIRFSLPVASDIIFNKITGTIGVNTSVVVTTEGMYATTTVSTIGAIY